jgi:AcrR family transcriptional regulator
MATRLTRRESKALTQRRLISAAREVFVRRGFHAATLEAVADEAGFTTGAVYSNFANKADLFLAVLDQHLGARVRDMAAIVAGEATVTAQMRAMARYWNKRRHDGPLWNLALIEFWAFAARDPELRQQFADRHERLLEELARVQEEAAAQRGQELPVSALDLQRAASAINHGMALEWLVSPDLVSEELLEWAFDRLARDPVSAEGQARSRSRNQPTRRRGGVGR